jgi:hypothetical protein
MKSPVWFKDYANRVGNTPWLEFIRAWAKFPFEENPFIQSKDRVVDDPNRLLILNGYVKSVDSSGNIYPFTEMYFVRETENHGWSSALKFVVFLDNKYGTARIECFDPALVAKCEEIANA